jgi:hypothetical protein
VLCASTKSKSVMCQYKERYVLVQRVLCASTKSVMCWYKERYVPVQRVLCASTKCVMCYYNVNTGTIGDMTQAHIAGSSLSNTCMSHYILNPQSVFLCVGCRLGGFVPLSGFFHGFVCHFYQLSRTNVDSFVS